jgi:hypothetical protein
MAWAKLCVSVSKCHTFLSRLAAAVSWERQTNFFQRVAIKAPNRRPRNTDNRELRELREQFRSFRRKLRGSRISRISRFSPFSILAWFLNPTILRGLPDMAVKGLAPVFGKS